jgi:hypothetical protein
MVPYVQIPCRSGSPHGVRGGVQLPAAAASLAPVAGAPSPAKGPGASDTTAIMVASARHAGRNRRIVWTGISILAVRNWQCYTPKPVTYGQIFSSHSLSVSETVNSVRMQTGSIPLQIVRDGPFQFVAFRLD